MESIRGSTREVSESPPHPRHLISVRSATQPAIKKQRQHRNKQSTQWTLISSSKRTSSSSNVVTPCEILMPCDTLISLPVATVPAPAPSSAAATCASSSPPVDICRYFSMVSHTQGADRQTSCSGTRTLARARCGKRAPTLARQSSRQPGPQTTTKSKQQKAAAQTTRKRGPSKQVGKVEGGHPAGGAGGLLAAGKPVCKTVRQPDAPRRRAAGGSDDAVGRGVPPRVPTGQLWSHSPDRGVNTLRLAADGVCQWIYVGLSWDKRRDRSAINTSKPV